MKRVHRQNPVLLLGFGLIAGPTPLFALAPSASRLSAPSQVLSQLPGTIQPLHKSLLFDQSFDKKVIRPFIPETVVAEYLERVEARGTPARPVAHSSAFATPAKAERAPAALAQIINASSQAKPVVADFIEALSSKKPAEAAKAAPVVAVSKPAVTPIAKIETAPSVPVTPAPAKAAETTAAVVAVRDVAKLKTLESKQAGVYVLDEDAFLENRFATVTTASVQWLHPDSKLSTKPNKQGVAYVPYANAYSSRFVVTAPGYLPAVGYAVKGMLSPVILYHDSRLGPVLKSLDQTAKPGQTILIGKFLSRDLKPIEKMSFDEFLPGTQTNFYSLGAFGLFHPAAKQTGPRGDFLINNLNKSLQYLLAKQDASSTDIVEWPAQLIDLKGLSPVLTTTLVAPKARALSTQLVDAFSLERPDTGVFASVGGQRGVVEADGDGILDLNEVFERPSVDLVEIHAQGYLKTWLNVPAISEALPDFVPLFTINQLDEVLRTVGASASQEQAYVIGSVHPENMRRKFEIKIFGSDGHEVRDAKIFYFGKQNHLSASAEAMDPKDARFVVTGLSEGEWHVVLVDAKNGEGRGIQVLRTQAGTISQTQF